MKFGPRNKNEAVIFAEEGFRVQIQFELYKLMKAKGWDLDDFAEAIDMDPATMAQIFESDCFVDIRILGRMFYALGVKPKFIFEKL
jgi:transcriptional regulator with XRE-family HTH domain